MDQFCCKCFSGSFLYKFGTLLWWTSILHIFLYCPNNIFFAKLALWIVFANLYNAETNHVAFYLTKFPKFHLKQNGKIDRIFFGFTYSIDLFGAELSSYQLSWNFSAFMPYNAIWTDKSTDPKINTFCS